MHIVEEYCCGDEFATAVWLSIAANVAIVKFVHKGKKQVSTLLEKVEYWAEKGFASFEGKKGYPIRHEWDGVYRIGLPASLFRLIGFYENDDKASFIIIDVLKKRGTGLSKSETSRIDAVAKVKREGLWERE